MSVLFSVVIVMGLVFGFIVYCIRKDGGYDIDYEKLIPVGSVWALYPIQNGPWAQDLKPSFVTVLDVKDGWVRYSFNGSTLFSDERIIARWFYKTYDRYDVPKA